MSSGDQVIHQLVHGYDRGHRLLAGSTPVADDVAAVVGRTSDAVPNYRPSTGPYLTGYSLPGGGYALARTWPAIEAQRPNTVWTHTLVLPASLLGRVSAGGLAQRLRHPGELVDLRSFAEPVSVAEVPAVGTTVTDAAAAAAGVAVYQQDAVVVAAADAGTSERLSLALWDQHWVPVRRTLSFCTAVDASPFEPSRRHTLSFASRTPRPVADIAARGDAWQVVTADLQRPAGFREWLHFVGSGERDHRLIATFAEIYLLLGAAPGNDSVRLAEEVLQRAGPGTGDLRRLKRRLLSFTESRPRWAVEPTAVFAALTTGRLGEVVAAEDASLDRWVHAAWLADPELVVRTVRSGVGPDATQQPAEDDDMVAVHAAERRAPAKEALPAAFDGAFTELLTPVTLAIAADLAAERVLAVLLSRADAQLWQAWAALPPTARKATLAGLHDAPADWRVAIGVLRGQPDPLRDLLSTRPDATDAVVEAVVSAPQRDDASLYPLPGKAARVVRDRAEEADTPQRVRALAYLASPSELPRKAQWPVWLKTLDTGHDPVVAAIAYLLGRKAGGQRPLEVAAAAVAVLYPVLAAGPAHSVWSRLDDQVTGDRKHWDRCRRLIDDFAKATAKLDDTAASALLGAVHARHAPAARALADSLDRRRKSDSRWSFFDVFRQ